MKTLISKFGLRKCIIFGIILLLLIFLPVVLDLSLSTMTIIVMVLLYMYWASSWNIMGGYTGLFSLGNGIYVGLGAYITACLYVYAGITPYMGIVLAGLITGLISIAIAFPAFRLQSVFYSLATIALLNALRIIFMNCKSIFGIYVGGSDGFKIPMSGLAINMQFASKLPYYYIILGLLFVVLLVSYYLSVTRSGYYFRAISANEGAAASMGINVFNMKVKAQFISAFFTAVGGGFYCIFINYISPDTLFSDSMSVNIMMMAVVGGANTLWGPVLGAGIMYTLNRVVTMYAPTFLTGVADFIFGIILMVCVFFMPSGILHYVAKFRENQKAKKHKAQLEQAGGR